MRSMVKRFIEKCWKANTFSHERGAFSYAFFRLSRYSSNTPCFFISAYPTSHSSTALSLAIFMCSSAVFCAIYICVSRIDSKMRGSAFANSLRCTVLAV